MNDHQRLPEIVAQNIKGMIIERSLNEGEKLPTESELTMNFNVSRSTIREAIKILIAENVVEIRHGRGTFIAKKTGITKDPLGLSFADRKMLLPNLLEARRLIEPNIAALAAQRRTKRICGNCFRLSARWKKRMKRARIIHLTTTTFTALWRNVPRMRCSTAYCRSSASVLMPVTS